MKLKEIFKLARHGELSGDFLYLPDHGNWTIETEGRFIEWTEEDLNANANLPREAVENNLVEGLDGQTIEGIVKWADRLAGKKDDSARLDVFLYYHKYDAYPDKLNSPPPPPANEIIARLDREFYDLLGKERSGTKCKKDDCERGTVQYSVLCKKHHFESIQKKPCPFDD